METRLRAVLFSVVLVLSYMNCAQADEQCKHVYQSASGSPMASASYLYEEQDEARLKICGAAPACSSCVEMAAGDCRYVFPTYVTVYPRKNNDGTEEVCACRVFACRLPWDPLGWSGRCMAGGELGCYSKPAKRVMEALPQSLCEGIDNSIRVKFVPMAFALQDYAKPGVRAIVYKGEKIVDRQYIFPDLASRQPESGGTASSQVVNGSATRQSSSSTAIEAHVVEGKLTVENSQHTYTLRRGDDDNVCIKYYGAYGKSESSLLINTCLPIPGLDLPIMYALSKQPKGVDITTTGQGQLHAHFRLQYDSDYDDKEYMGYLITAPGNLFYGQDSAAAGGAQGTDCSFQFKLDDKSNTTIGKRFPGYNVLYPSVLNENKRSHGVSFEHAQNMCRVAKNVKPSESHDSGQSDASFCTYYASSVGSTAREAPAQHVTVQQHSGSDNWRGEVVCARGVLRNDLEYVVVRECATGEECPSSIGLLEKVESFRSRDAKIGGFPSTPQLPGEEDSDAKPRYTSFRVRKKPKTLRRYVVVTNDGIKRRVRCDDRYSIDLHAVSQEVLDQARVSNNKFVFPKSYLESSVRSDSQDPCESSSSNIVYYYEYGGFVSATGVGACANPVEEYYAPGKKVVGCEYDYIRTDNYQPFLVGLGDSSNLAVLPVSEYEQGLCVDNFEKSWFKPTYSTESQSAREKTWSGPTSDACCKWDVPQVVGHTVRGSTGSFHVGRKRTVYRYKLQSDVAAQKSCTLYRVEMWGGGEGAIQDARGVKRSGRPGQYTMVLLDYEKLRNKKSSYKAELEEKRKRPSEAPDVGVLQINSGEGHSLVFDIGEGGINDSSGNAGGTDTILRLCNDDMWAGARTNVLGNDINDKWGQVFKEGTSSTTDGIVATAAYDKKYVNDKCYEIARAVGGGSRKLGRLQSEIAKDIVVYYKTISGDVLAGDRDATGLLEGHNAMFTKFSLEMNLGRKSSDTQEDLIKAVVTNRRFFEGRSLPSEFCTFKADRMSYPPNEEGLFIPGMGGCWKRDSQPSRGATGTEAEGRQGVGENGAVMITCERWAVNGDTATSPPKK